MLSPVQRWLADPTNCRWEQPSYEGLSGLCATSVRLRKRQALTLWTRDVLTMRQQVSALAWAKMYAGIALPIVQAFPQEFKSLAPDDHALRWLHCVAYFPKYAQKDTLSQAPGEHGIRLLRELGHEHVLSRALVEHVCLESEQIEFWRQIFPHDPMHDKMHIALSVQAVRRQTLDGYLRARKHLSIEEKYEAVDLSILDGSEMG